MQDKQEHIILLLKLDTILNDIEKLNIAIGWETKQTQE
jgi:hypothetical protein